MAALTIGIVYQHVEQGDTLRLFEETALKRQVMLLRVVVDKMLQ